MPNLRFASSLVPSSLTFRGYGNKCLVRAKRTVCAWLSHFANSVNVQDVEAEAPTSVCCCAALPFRDLNGALIIFSCRLFRPPRDKSHDLSFSSMLISEQPTYGIYEWTRPDSIVPVRWTKCPSLSWSMPSSPSSLEAAFSLTHLILGQFTHVQASNLAKASSIARRGRLSESIDVSTPVNDSWSCVERNPGSETFDPLEHSAPHVTNHATTSTF